jgi:hypothetical protein
LDGAQGRLFAVPAPPEAASRTVSRFAMISGGT